MGRLVELPALDQPAPASFKSGAEFVQQYFARVSNALRGAWGIALSRGELRGSVDPPPEAAFCTASVLAILVMPRAHALPAVLKGASRVALEYIEAFRT